MPLTPTKVQLLGKIFGSERALTLWRSSGHTAPRVLGVSARFFLRCTRVLAVSRTGQHRARRRPSFHSRRALAVSLDTPRRIKNFAHQSCAQRDEPRVRLRGAKRGEQTREERAIESPRELGGRGHAGSTLTFPLSSLLSCAPPRSCAAVCFESGTFRSIGAARCGDSWRRAAARATRVPKKPHFQLTPIL